MKILICLFLFISIIFAIDTTFVPTTFTANTKAKSSEVNANFDTNSWYTNRLVDTVEAKFIRFTDLTNRDSTLDTLQVIYMTVDTIDGAVGIDTARTLLIDSRHGTLSILLNPSAVGAIFQLFSSSANYMNISGTGDVIQFTQDINLEAGAGSTKFEVQGAIRFTDPFNRNLISFNDNLTRGLVLGISDGNYTFTDSFVIIRTVNSDEQVQIHQKLVVSDSTTAQQITATGNINFDGGTFIFNESSADLDVRFESDGNDSMFFIDGANDMIGVGHGTPLTDLHIRRTEVAGTDANLRVEANDFSELSIISSADGTDGGPHVKRMIVDRDGLWKFRDESKTRNIMEFDTSGAIVKDEQLTTPTNPSADDQAKIYVKANKFILQWNDGGTVRYKYLDLTGAGVTWVHTTSAP